MKKLSEEWRLSGSSEIGEKCVRKTKGKKKKKGLRPAFNSRGLSPAQKKRGHTHIKRGFRAGLRPRVKNGAEN